MCGGNLKISSRLREWGCEAYIGVVKLLSYACGAVRCPQFKCRDMSPQILKRTVDPSLCRVFHSNNQTDYTAVLASKLRPKLRRNFLAIFSTFALPDMMIWVSISLAGLTGRTFSIIVLVWYLRSTASLNLCGRIRFTVVAIPCSLKNFVESSSRILW